MRKSTINSGLLIIGLTLLLCGLGLFWLNSKKGTVDFTALLLLFAGIFILTKTLRKTKDLPSKAFKERLKENE